MIIHSTEEVRSGQRSKAFVLATTSVQLNKIGGKGGIRKAKDGSKKFKFETVNINGYDYGLRSN